jgi:hypothetical protein
MAAMTSCRWWCGLLFASVAACRSNVQPGAGLAPADQAIVARYLTCIDCDLELDSLLALNTRKPDATVDSLNSALLLGPATHDVAAAESVLVIGYVRDSTWRLAHGLKPLPERLIHVGAARDRYVNGYRSQGAFGMGYIGSPRARALLDSALNQVPTWLRAAVVYSRDSLPQR